MRSLLLWNIIHPQSVLCIFWHLIFIGMISDSFLNMHTSEIFLFPNESLSCAIIKGYILKIREKGDEN